MSYWYWLVNNNICSEDLYTIVIETENINHTVRKTFCEWESATISFTWNTEFKDGYFERPKLPINMPECFTWNICSSCTANSRERAIRKIHNNRKSYVKLLTGWKIPPEQRKRNLISFKLVWRNLINLFSEAMPLNVVSYSDIVPIRWQ